METEVNILSKIKHAENTAPVLSPEKKLEIDNTRKYMFDMLLMLFAPAVMAWYYYGERAVRLMALSVITAVLCELAGSKIFKAKATVSDLSAVVTGLAIALCVPASSPWWLACAASAFAIIVAKLPFGNSRGVMFLPAAAGLAFITICCPKEFFTYPAIPALSEKLAVYGSDGFVSGTSIAYMLTQRTSIGINVISYIDILVGNVVGPMGAACAVALLGAFVYLMFRRPKNAIIPVMYFAVCAVYAFLFTRVSTGRLISVVMELSGGLLLFGGVFFMTNEILAPKRFIAKLCYGACGGLIVMLMRTFGTYEDSTVFAVLIVNAIAPVLDKKIPLTKKEKRILLEQQRQAEQGEENGNIPESGKTDAEILEMVEKVKENIKKQQQTQPRNGEVPSNTEAERQDDDVPTLQALGDIEAEDKKEEHGGGENV